MSMENRLPIFKDNPLYDAIHTRADDFLMSGGQFKHLFFGI